MLPLGMALTSPSTASVKELLGATATIGHSGLHTPPSLTLAAITCTGAALEYELSGLLAKAVRGSIENCKCPFSLSCVLPFSELSK